MKSILLSIKPEYVAKILNGEKTIEIRKHAIPVRTKVYVYCTKGDKTLVRWSLEEEHYFLEKCDRNKPHYYNGKVVASFVVSKCEKHDYSKYYFYKYPNLIRFSVRLTASELENYGNKKPLFAWHISQLKIFDKPKELNEFQKYGMYKWVFDHCHEQWVDDNWHELIYVQKAPKSYCYVEEIE